MITLTDEQKRQLFHDGYIVLKGVVSDDLVEAGQARIKKAQKGENLSGATELTDLVNASGVTPILNEVMGQFDPPSRVQVGVIKQSGPKDFYSPLGYRERDLPYFGHGMHAEGLFTVGPPQQPAEGTPDEIYKRLIASGPRGDLGRSADVIGSNTDPLFQDPDMTLSVGSFTAFVIVPLNDQRTEGCGQTAVIPGGHHILESFYRWQYEQSGCIGPEGPGWPRFDYETPNRAGHIYLPRAVQEKLIELIGETPETTPDGRPWPRPTQILMEPGDAAITIFQMPHTGTRNEFGTESRKNMIFRIRNKSRQPDKVVSGVSDHPDRGQMGEWLEYEPGNDPFARSKQALTHMWQEWEGMQDIVAQESANLTPVDYSHVDV
ncbi:MAG: hypothetical protein O2780_16765 [Proteobacteria bacterium]|nr:hypothetical protein [Pseudomonadota bacterium]MDA1302029.1 hypothetical protein [Pseudomonadota bacterium]